MGVTKVDELLKIEGVGDARIRKYGADLITAIAGYVGRAGETGVAAQAGAVGDRAETQTEQMGERA